jgi:hypothetical protein
MTLDWLECVTAVVTKAVDDANCRRSVGEIYNRERDKNVLVPDDGRGSASNAVSLFIIEDDGVPRRPDL